MFIFISRTFSFALKSFWRNLGLSLMTITILLLALISFNTVLTVRAIADKAINLVQERIDVSLLFKPEAPSDKIEEIRAILSKMPAISHLTYKTREEVLQEFKNKHAQDKEILTALDELKENPLGAALIVQAKNTKDYEEILKAVNIPEYNQIIEEKTFDDHAAIIKKLGAITGRVKNLGIGLTLILTIVSFLIIFNVIRVAIYTHREEISIMKLVGASNWFVRAPFLLETLIYSFLAVFISTLLLYLGLNFLNRYLGAFFEGTSFSLISYFNSNFLKFFGGELLAMIILNFLSAWLAMRRYLKV